MKSIRLENWSTYLIPGQVRLVGEVYGDQRGRPDGKEVLTSKIKLVADGAVITESGTKYVLGKSRYDETEARIVELLEDQQGLLH